ncbi:MAG: hypothetical protein ABIK89_16080, partial [Planctomycetota bacterium]
MKTISRTGWAGGLAALVLLVLAGPATVADTPFAERFQPEDTIQTLAVTIEVGAAGEDLTEPVALDLGLGFPFWLHPVGRPENTTAPFGAVPQQTTAQGRLPAGSSATFTFDLAGDPGQDVFLTTPQLLARVRVSDISRVGFASSGSTGWVLDGYEIQVNGRPLASGKALGVSPKQAQDAVHAKLKDLQLKIQPLLSERSAIEDFIKAKLATEADTKRLVEVEAELVPLLKEQYRCERQLQGKHPWFEDAQFVSPWREKGLIGSAKVTLVTRTHGAADTRNHIYLQTGGHKYLLGTLAAPLSAARGPQVFPLDLVAGPLTAGDLRGFAVGMLAPANPYARAPDRWHPERILVEVDGRTVYDSEENALDRDSLKAIRLIPPVHVDEQGMLVTNTPIARETFLWEAGKGQGLDLAAGGDPEDLPPTDSPSYPDAEPGPDPGLFGEGGITLPDTDPDEQGMPQDVSPQDTLPQDTLPPDDAFGDFPGEQSCPTDPGSSLGDEYPSDGSTYPPDDGTYPPDGSDNAPDWGQGSLGSGSPLADLLAWIWWLLHGTDGAAGGAGSNQAPGPEPSTAGEPFQIKEGSVAITKGLTENETFTIQWDIVGDENEIDHYEVSLIEVYPDRPDVLGATLLKDSMPFGSRDYSGKLQAAKASDAYWVMPVVVAVPSDPQNATSSPRFGPARPLFPAPMVGFPLLRIDERFSFTVEAGGALAIGENPIYYGGPPAGTELAVWPAGALESHNAIRFDQAWPATNVGLRTAADTTVTVGFKLSSAVPPGKYR